MNIPKSLMAILLAVALTFSAAGLSNATYAAEAEAGDETVADTHEDGEAEIAVETEDHTADDSEDGIPSANNLEAQKEAPLPAMPDELKAPYTEAIKSITPFNKVEALAAALNSATNISKFADLVKVEDAISHVKGFSPLESMTDNWVTSDTDVTARDELIDALLAADSKLEEATLQSKTFPEIITLAKSNALYSEELVGTPPSLDGEDNPAANPTLNFTTLVNQCQTMYDQGVATLQKLLPAVGASPTAIESMNGEALAKLATSVDEYDNYGFYYAYVVTTQELDKAAEEHTWGLFLSYLNATLTWFENQAKAVSNYNTDALVNAYGRLVAVAKSVDPEFTVDLSNVTRLTTLPTLPNTGSLADSENSASMVAIALGGIAATVTLAGLGLTAKRFLFSPLKHRR